jgi:hypothetical protein
LELYQSFWCQIYVFSREENEDGRHHDHRIKATEEQEEIPVRLRIEPPERFEMAIEHPHAGVERFHSAALSMKHVWSVNRDEVEDYNVG